MNAFEKISNEEKENLLGIDKEKIDKYGAVSSEICMEMLLGTERKIPADIYIVSTGVAGPDKDEKGNDTDQTRVKKENEEIYKQEIIELLDKDIKIENVEGK